MDDDVPIRTEDSAAAIAERASKRAAFRRELEERRVGEGERRRRLALEAAVNDAEERGEALCRADPSGSWLLCRGYHVAQMESINIGDWLMRDLVDHVVVFAAGRAYLTSRSSLDALPWVRSEDGRFRDIVYTSSFTTPRWYLRGEALAEAMSTTFRGGTFLRLGDDAVDHTGRLDDHGSGGPIHSVDAVEETDGPKLRLTISDYARRGNAECLPNRRMYRHAAQTAAACFGEYDAERGCCAMDIDTVHRVLLLLAVRREGRVVGGDLALVAIAEHIESLFPDHREHVSAVNEWYDGDWRPGQVARDLRLARAMLGRPAPLLDLLYHCDDVAGAARLLGDPATAELARYAREFAMDLSLATGDLDATMLSRLVGIVRRQGLRVDVSVWGETNGAIVRDWMAARQRLVSLTAPAPGHGLQLTIDGTA